MLVHYDPARCCRTAAATFGAVLNVDLAVVFGFTFETWQVGQYGLAQAHAGGAGQEGDGGRTGMLFAKRFDDAHNLLMILALGSGCANGGPLHSQRVTRARHFHILITTKRGHGPVHAGHRFCAVAVPITLCSTCLRRCPA